MTENNENRSKPRRKETVDLDELIEEIITDAMLGDVDEEYIPKLKDRFRQDLKVWADEKAVTVRKVINPGTPNVYTYTTVIKAVPAKEFE